MNKKRFLTVIENIKTSINEEIDPTKEDPSDAKQLKDEFIKNLNDFTKKISKYLDKYIDE